jgi:hypothetical protein
MMMMIIMMIIIIIIINLAISFLPRFDLGSVHVGFVVDKLALGRVSLPVL